ncbi:helix-turn-helix domain-containing protein [Anaerosphaera multitolerans]|uniref:Mga helix-turn-helix domain-containing protein n=1 Tax=Anaerosphaera multitolerans TaxID=2487351 RepID=A0A437S5X7_9FIRM|nr:helix-turn-helix domain-containing protein [Anaerosphaera multitolerans]RVU54409.1 hypothetical protein EF514_07385 [Anaerosphaera multitolerans]
MRLLLSKRDQRQLEFLELLIKESRITLNQVSEISGYPVRTLSSDIIQMNSYLESIEVETGPNGVALIIPKDSSIREIYRLILEQSREFQLLIYLFFNKNKSQEDIAEELFISISTFRRMVSTLNEKLSRSEIYINSGPFRIEGNESNISKLYIALFSELYDDIENITEVGKYEILIELCQKMAKSGGFALNYPDRTRIWIWTYVRLMRILSGYHLAGYENSGKNLNFEVLRDKEFCEKFKRVWEIELSGDLLVELFHLFLRPEFVRSIADIKKLKKHSEYHRGLDFRIETLFNVVAKALKISTEDTKELHIDLFNIIQFSDTPVYALYDKNKIFTEGFLKNNKSIATIIFQKIEEVFSELKNVESIYAILYLLVTHWPSLLGKIKDKAPKVQMGIFLDTDVEHAEMVSDLIRGYSRLKIEILNSTITEAIDLENSLKNIDVLITNIPKFKVSCCEEVVCINEYPTSDDFKNILLAEERIYQKKIMNRQVY